MLRKKLKKSSVVLMAGLFLMGSSVGVLAESTGLYTFEQTLVEPTVKYTITEERRFTRIRPYSSVRLQSSTCSEATTYFDVLDPATNAVASADGISVSNSDLSKRDITFINDYSNNGDVTLRLRGKINSGHTGYKIVGIWNPNGLDK